MSAIRPKVILTNGRVQQPVRVQNQDVVVDPIQTILISDTSVSSNTLSVKNIAGFGVNQILLLNEPGNQGSEIVKTNGAIAPNGNIITLVSGTSVTTLTPSIASKAFATQLGLSFTTGDRVRATSDGTPSVFMEGDITSYSGTTLILNVDTIGTASSESDWTLRQVTKLPHSSSTFVSVIPYDQIQFSIASTIAGMKSVLVTTPLLVDQFYTEYDDVTNSSGFYFARFKSTITGLFSTYSDPAPYEGYGILSARAVIDSALGEINKNTSEVLSDVFAFTQLDNCQTECIRELKRWSFMQKFNFNIGSAATGTWKLPMPIDLDDQNTNASVYILKLGANPRLTWVDFEKFNDLLNDMVYSTLAAPALNGDTTLTLVESSDFVSNGSGSGNNGGTVQIGDTTYAYTNNDIDTGVLTLNDPITVDTTQPNGSDVFGNIQTGLPTYWTTYGGYLYWFPVTAAAYNLKNMYLSYYIKQVRITSDYDNLIIPDPIVAVNYLCWKFLKKLNNGEDTAASQVYFQNYIARREKMKQKETMNRTFIFKPRYQNFAIQSEFDENDSRIIRDGNFPNTGF